MGVEITVTPEGIIMTAENMTNAGPTEWSSELAAACSACRTGGAILLDWAKRFTAREKSRANMVTEADLASQKAIFEELTLAFPAYGFLGEEDAGHDQQTASKFDGSRWIVDPLDGTGNYVHQFPYYAVSIGLEHDGQLVVGAIYDPTRDELFSAARGAGAFLNENPITVSCNDTLAESFCVASLPVGSDGDNIAVRRFLGVIPKAQTVQRTGSAALNLCGVACGRIDAFWSTSLNPWDMAAGVVIVREAGGTVTKCNESDFDLFTKDLLATNGLSLHSEVSNELQAVN